MFIICQAAEIADAAKGWGDQLPALALGLLGIGVITWLFLRRLKEMDEASGQERAARDALFTGAIREVSERADETARVCHETQKAATDRERETATVLGAVRGALDRNATVTQDVGKCVEEARREIARLSGGRAA